MSLTSTLTTESLTTPKAGDQRTLTRTYRVLAESEATPLTLDGVRGHADCPIKLRERLAVPLNYWVCQEVGVTQLAPDMFDVSGSFTTRAVGNGEGLPTQAFARMSIQSRQRNIKMWKRGTGAWLATDGDAAFPPVATISGDSLDIHGAPADIPSFQISVTVDTQHDRAYLMFSESDPLGAIAGLDDMVNTRNDAEWYGWPVGYVVMNGYSLTNIDDQWQQLSIHFTVDEYAHLQQRVALSLDGRFLPGTPSTWLSTPIQHAGQVYWFQPYPTKTTFPTWSEITTPTPEWVE